MNLKNREFGKKPPWFWFKAFRRWNS